MCEMKGFITNLGKYNEGYLVGKWIDFPIDDDEFENELASIGVVSGSMYEEWFITDYDCALFDMNAAFGEYPNIDDINEVAEALEDNEDEFVALLEVCQDYSEALERLEKGNYIFYSGMTLLDLAYELIDQCYNLPEFALRYFDYEAYARDLDADYTEVDGGVICLD